MPESLYILRFIAVVLLVLAAAHYSLWWHLIKATGLSGRAKSIGTAVIIALFLLLPLSRIVVARQLPLQYTWYLSWLAYLWLGMAALFFALFLSVDCLSIVWRILCRLFGKHRQNSRAAQRQGMARAFAISAVALVCGMTAFGVKRAADPPTVKQFKLRMAGLPAAFQGFRIVQMTDIHLGAMTTAAQLAAIVQQVNSLQPDIVAITGDMVDGSTEQLATELAHLARLKSTEGVFFVTGNHEYYSGAEEWIAEIKRLGVQVLDNQRVEIRRGEDALVIAGVTDHKGGMFGHPPDYAQALHGIPPGEKIILLAHQPIAAQQAVGYGVDLVLSGHTHGGQIWPLSSFVYLQQPYLKGFHMAKDKTTLVYVSQGTGCWGPPIRIGTTNEITVFILT